MSARKPTPYSSFSAYNKFEVEQKQQQDEVQKRQQQMSQHVSKNAPMSQENTQMNQHMSQPQQGQFQQQQGQFQPFQQPFVYEEPVIKQRHHNHFFDPEELSCMTVSNHIKDCPICSKFYNCDNSMYIVCIVLLIMVCVILLKKIIEK